MQNFAIPSFDWFDTMFTSHLMLGAVQNTSLDPSALPFQGSLSCLQMFGSALNSAQIQYKSYCADASKILTPPCPTGYQFYDGVCIGVSNSYFSLITQSSPCGINRRRQMINRGASYRNYPPQMPIILM
jgi:hypothetical protein